MNAQVIYDFQSEGGCDGAAMRDFFVREIGLQSPSGKLPISESTGKEFMRESLDAIIWNSSNLEGWVHDMKEAYVIGNGK